MLFSIAIKLIVNAVARGIFVSSIKVTAPNANPIIKLHIADQLRPQLIKCIKYENIAIENAIEATRISIKPQNKLIFPLRQFLIWEKFKMHIV